MFRIVWVAAIAASSLTWSAEAASWRLGPPTPIHPDGTCPSLWAGTIAYLNQSGGPVMYYDGSTSIEVYDPVVSSWEPANGNGSVAWRNSVYGSLDCEILRWDGEWPIVPVNVSNSSLMDNDLSAAGNGDLIWSRNATWLMYYDASEGTTVSLGVDGVQPSLYITDGGVATYAYQDPNTNGIKYFDGTTTHSLGPGASFGAVPSLWDGAVAWIGQGVGSYFKSAEVFYWKDGQTYRLTNDDAVNGVTDENPTVWNDLVIWPRRCNGLTSPPDLLIWDGTDTTLLLTEGGAYPSFHDGQVAYVDADGLQLADVLPVAPGDCNTDGYVDLIDYVGLEACLTGPGGGMEPECECFDLDDSGDVDLADFARFQQEFTGS